MKKYKENLMSIKKIVLLSSSIIFMTTFAHADEGGTSFWLPGQYGSLSATPAEPGWSLPIIYYHSSVDAGASKAFEIGGEIRAGLDVGIDMFFAIPNYVFSDPVWGGQASMNMTMVLGRVDTTIDATLTGPNGGVLSGSQNDSLTSNRPEGWNTWLTLSIPLCE